MKDWKGIRVLILGAARQGLALARYLAQQGAQVTLNDQRPAEVLEAARQQLADLPIRWVTGSHPLELLNETDEIYLSGGIPLTIPLVMEAMRRNMPLSNDSQVFMDAVPCRVIAITGSAGKTTTTTLVGRMAQAALKAPRRSWVGGNIGLPLVNYLHEIRPDDVVILELSSFQLEQMTTSPQVAAVLNITPNHLDRHGTMEAYTAAKARLLDFQAPGDIAVLCREDPGSWGLVERVRGRLISFGFEPPAAGQAGTYLRSGQLCLSDGAHEQVLFSREQITLRGEHNVLNVLAACAIAAAAGFPVEAMQTGVFGFDGVAHRLELVRVLQGVAWYNDSIATAPERTAAAVHSFNEPVVLLLGGRDKKLPYEDLVALIRQRVDHVIVFGEASQKILQALGEAAADRRPYSITHCAGLQEAVLAARQISQPGDVVLLSPSCTSFDEFKDFEERGERFREWVNQLS